MNTWQKGELAVLKIMQRCAEKNIIVSKPTTDNSRYDLILDINGKLQRVQVKYAGISNGIATCSLVKKSSSKSAKYRTYTSKEIDLVLAYIPEKDVICLFTSNEFENKTTISIRLEKTKNNQIKDCNFLEMFQW